MDTPAFSVQALPAPATGGPYGAPGRRTGWIGAGAPVRPAAPPRRRAGVPVRPEAFSGDDDLSVPWRRPRSVTRAPLVGGVGKRSLVAFLVPGAAASVTTSTTATWSDEPADGR
ncbi:MULTISPECIES: hypothetical protein [unclassified Streptomyces]|uniref:hypothetical protein n=1 Tax=unclassified Streptomyces TaxID=2593676 RepID=UPI00380536A3